ncbi:MAG TPA: thermostable hemolysin [Gammaproteobacteria bacterium]|nr:thermostable hemolysin [Gammaproteobacteria bacterium]
MAAIQHAARAVMRGLVPRHTITGSPRRAACEAFISGIFRRRHGAVLQHFAPNLVLLERSGRIAAAAGWRSAADEALFLECYLDEPVEAAVGRVAGHAVSRARIVEVGHLASDTPGGTVAVILALADRLDRLGFEWVVFTATDELIAIFRRLGLPPLAIAAADQRRLGEQADRWGRYYDSRPVVVAGRIRLALERAVCRD